MNILTFDVEEWFHLLDNESTKSEKEWSGFESRLDANMDRIFEILAEHQQPATFFCLGWVARKFPHIIKKIVDGGYEIGSHSNSHQLAFEQTPSEFKADLDQSIKRLEDVSGQKIRAYRSPGFSVMEKNKWIFEELIAAGIEIDSSVFPASRAHGGFPSFGEETPTIIHTASGTLKEFPINTTSVLGRKIIFSGGGYFRLFPWVLIDYFMNKSEYVMTYFHPRDFDADQPMVPGLSKVRKLKSYYGLDGAETKIRRLIKEHELISLGQAVEACDWSEVPVVQL